MIRRNAAGLRSHSCRSSQCCPTSMYSNVTPSSSSYAYSYSRSSSTAYPYGSYPNSLCPPRRPAVYLDHQLRLTKLGLGKSAAIRSSSSQSKGDDKNSTAPPTYAKIGVNNNQQSSSSDANDLVGSITKQMKSIPNVITTTRIASTPFISYLILNEQYQYAVGGCIAFGLTDWLDGYIAKNYKGQRTVLGTYLDPLADKIMVNALAASLWQVSLLPGPIVGIWLARDVGLIVTSFAAVSRATKKGNYVINPATTPLKVEPTMISKVNTVLQFLTISGGMAQPLFGLSPDIVMGLW